MRDHPLTARPVPARLVLGGPVPDGLGLGPVPGGEGGAADA